MELENRLLDLNGEDNSEENILEKKNLDYTNNYVSSYPQILLLISLFYSLPSFQFIFFQIKEKNIHCYYNYKCKHDLGIIPAFNNINSNISYIFFGIIFIIHTIIRSYKYYNKDTGVEDNPFLFCSAGITLILEGIFSAMYHTCPSRLNFQFDSTFMFIGISLMILCLYQKRNFKNIPRPTKTFSLLSIAIFANLLPLVDISNGNENWFWILNIIAIFYIMFSISIKFWLDFSLVEFIKYVNFQKLRKNREKLIVVVISNLITISMLIYGTMNKPSFTIWLLSILISNFSVFLIYYILNKIYYQEEISKFWFISLFFSIICIITSFVFFKNQVKNIDLSPEESRKLNQKCILFNYWDNHDVWHFLSALGIFILLELLLNIDNNLLTKKKSEIPRF